MLAYLVVVDYFAATFLRVFVACHVQLSVND